jgi:hypothetical protein
MLAAKDTLFTRPSGAYKISRSVRLRSSASAYFNRTLGSGNKTKHGHCLVRVKRGASGSSYILQTFGPGGFANRRFYFVFF